MKVKVSWPALLGLLFAALLIPSCGSNPEQRLGQVVDEFVAIAGSDGKWLPSDPVEYETYRGGKRMDVNIMMRAGDSRQESTALMVDYLKMLGLFSAESGHDMLAPYAAWRAEAYWREKRSLFDNEQFSSGVNPFTRFVYERVVGTPEQAALRFMFWGSLPSRLQDRQAIHEYVAYLKSTNPSAW